tara:strand:+ start:937 stop:1137 length:201 start_codon:yes stop_codon:yes gene_type:complete
VEAVLILLPLATHRRLVGAELVELKVGSGRDAARLAAVRRPMAAASEEGSARSRRAGNSQGRAQHR